MGLFEENQAHFADLRSGITYTGQEEGLTGRIDANNNFIGDPTTGVDAGYLWVRRGVTNRAQTRALIGAGMSGYEHLNGKRVRLGYNPSNELTAIEPIVDQQEATQNGGINSSPDLQNVPQPARLITGGRVLPSKSAELNVAVEPLVAAGLLNWVDPYDISADVPATSGALGWSVLYVNADGTLGHAVSTAYVLSGVGALDIPTAVAVPIPAGATRLWAVSLFNGQTDILASNTRFEDLRRDFVPEGVGFIQSIVAGTNVTVDNTDPANPIVSSTGGGGGGSSLTYILIQDQKSQNTQSGTFTSGAWQTRVLNTKVTDTGGDATLSSNQIALTAGTYRLRASAPAWHVDRHQVRWQNITDSTTTLIGTSEFSPNPGGGNNPVTRSFVDGRFTISSGKTFELQHRCQSTQTNQGFGVEANFTTEIYAEVVLEKET